MATPPPRPAQEKINLDNNEEGVEGNASLPQANHYQVLGLTPSSLDSSGPGAVSTLIKRAYHRALLRHHPDKAPPRSSPGRYSIDQIALAYAVLASPRQRAAYDARLRLAASAPAASAFSTGLEVVDLDEVAVDEASGRWYRSCRCGNDRGFSFDEADLMEADHGLGVLLVGCQDCSLWLKVHFAVMECHESADGEADQLSG